MKADLLGAALFTVLLASVSALAILPAPDRAVLGRPISTHRVAPGAPVDFVVAPDARAVKLVAIAEAVPEPTGDLAREQGFELDLAWLDDADRPVDSVSLHLLAGPALQAPVGVDTRPSLLVPRTTWLPAPLHHAGTLRVSVPAGHTAVRVRAFQDRASALDDRQLALLRVDERDAETLARQLGVDDWHDVSREEALRLTALRWQALYPRRATLPDDAAVVTLLPDPPLPAVVREAVGVQLAPGETTAWGIRGPVTVHLVAEGALRADDLTLVVEDQGAVAVHATPVSPPAWRPEAHALAVRLPPGGDATLSVQASARLGRLLLLVDRTEVPDLPSFARAVPARAFAPSADPDTWSVLPSTLELPAWHVASGATLGFALPPTPTDQIVRLDLRPLVAHGASMPVALLARTARGDREVEIEVRSEAEPGVHVARPGGVLDPAQPVGGRVTRYVHVPPGTTSLELAAPGTAGLLAGVDLVGPELGRHDAWDDTRHTIVRYAFDGRTPWIALEPHATADAPPEPWSVRVLRRREVLPPEEGGVDGRPRSFTTVDPRPVAGAVPGELWLAPPAPDDPGAGVIFCPVDAGSERPLAWGESAAARLGGALEAVLWAPGATSTARLGDPWTLQVDGLPWRHGLHTSAVLRHVAHHAPARRVALDAPSGARAWVRVADDDALPCPDGQRPRRVVTATPTRPLRLTVHKTLARQLLVVGGLGDGPVDVAVVIRHDARDVPLVSEAWTQRARVLQLLPRSDGARATDLEQPRHQAPVLQPAGLALLDDLRGRVDIELRPARGSVDLYVVTEVVPGHLPDDPGLRRIAR